MTPHELVAIAAKEAGLDADVAMQLVDEGDCVGVAIAKLQMAKAISTMSVQELARLQPAADTPMGIIQALALSARVDGNDE
jgi:hypothetical protein